MKEKKLKITKSKKRNSRNKKYKSSVGSSGSNLYVKNARSGEKSAKRVHLVMKIIIALVIVGLIIVFAVVLKNYLLPYFQSEFTPDRVESSELTSSDEEYIPPPQYDDLGLEVYDNDINLFLINMQRPDEEYAPSTEKVNGVKVEKRIADAVRLMLNKAKEDGFNIAFSKGYTSFKEQNKLYEEKVEELMQNEDLTLVMARENAKEFVPPAGSSDFQTGMCIEIEADKETFSDSQTYDWLSNNMSKYGFTFRFPQGKEKSTGVVADNTVIRYVGKENAEKMRQLTMCLEEYDSYLRRQGTN